VRSFLDHVRWPESVGLALLLAWVAWVGAWLFVADRMPSLSSPYLVAPLVLVAGVVGGRALPRHGSAPRLHVVLLALAVVLVAGVPLTAEPGKAPLGYANANAALAVQLVGMSGLALLATPPRRRALLGATVLLGVLAVALNRSAAGLFVVGPVVAAVALTVWRPPRRRWWATALGAATVVASAALIMSLADRTPWPSWAHRAFDPVREQLWRDAIALWNVRPLIGSGPGSFSEATALSVDPDTSTAHSLVLQVGSETGWVGVTILALVAVTGLVLAAQGTAPATVVGTATWTALLVHSQVDHLLEFAPVVLAAGAVLGWASATTHANANAGSEQLDVSERERPLGR
jgi:hypothetical protein